MRRLLPILILAACTIHAPAAADDGDAADPRQFALPAGISATMKSKGNVRFGPSINARVVRSLDPGEIVEIVGPAQVPDWFIIRFPQQASAWVHEKVIQSVDGGKRWKVTTDGGKARDDATLKGNIVAELAIGEILEDRNRTVGQWHAVYVPSAVAYVHRSVLNLPDDQAVRQQKAKGEAAQKVWRDAQSTYATYYAALQRDATSATNLDWSGLSQQLQAVAKDHPEAAIRLSAQRIKDGIERVVEASQAVAQSHGKPPAQGRPATGSTGTGTTGPASGTTGTATASDPIARPGTSVETLHVPPNQETAPTIPADPARPAVAQTPRTFAAEGCVSENSDYPKVGAANLLIDGNSNIVAFLTMKPGSTLNLSEYYWRWVGVAGESTDIDPDLHGMGRKIPMIVVDDIALLKK
ncbi:MAG: SH3 domain-containing protein [Planctomycetes bacterium]|nr:SH3 domain-containing protein [Planctomycetota bacterium]